MSNERAVWPELVFAALLIVAGFFMLSYGVRHLVKHHEILSPLLAGSGAIVLGACYMRQVLRPRSPRRSRHKRRPPTDKTGWWFCVAVISVIGASFGSAQVATDTLSDAEMAGDAPGLSAKSTRANQKLVGKYDLNRIGHRGIGQGFNLYSTKKEQKLGRRLATEIDRRVREVGDPVVTEYFAHLCQALSRHSDSHVPLTLKVIEDEEPNIFALPGGILYVTTGLVAVVDNEAELAALISHEIAHVTARHATKLATRRALWRIVSTPAMFLGPFGILAKQIGGVAVPLKLSRNAELEADLLGLQYLYLAGYDPNEFVRFLDRAYVGQNRSSSRMAQIFSDYPMLQERIGRAQEVISTFPTHAEYVLDTGALVEVKDTLALTRVELRRRATDSSSPRLRRHVR